MKFFVFTHCYNNDRTWWEPWHPQIGTSPEPVEAVDLDALIDTLRFDGLYSIFTLSDEDTHVEVRVETKTIQERQVIKR